MLVLLIAAFETIMLMLAFLPEEVIAVMVAVPFLSALTTPFDETVTILLLLVVHLILSVEDDGVIIGLMVRFLPTFSVLEVTDKVILLAGKNV